MMETSAFGMVTILSLTVVSNKTSPHKIWSSKTIAPESTWQGMNSLLSQGNWTPAYHVDTFLGRPGAKIVKLNEGQLSQIDASLNGQVINATTIFDTCLHLRNDGNLIQIASYSTNPIYTSLTAPLWAPIQLRGRTSTSCITASASNVTSLNTCVGQANQQWMLNKINQVVNQGTGTCLDVATDNSARSNKCDSRKSTQKWSWVDGYLKLTATGKCLKVKSAIGTSFSLETGRCPGLRMAWNK
jgi:hypothetical protein